MLFQCYMYTQAEYQNLYVLVFKKTQIHIILSDHYIYIINVTIYLHLYPYASSL
jgi:hypothetical protein